jgi:DNA repair protein REV1
MGSRLEKNSNDVRKRIQSHEFHDEAGEEYEASTFGGFSDYMRRKKLKLQNLDAEIRAQSSQKPQIFKGIVAHVNGYTQPSLSDLHTMIVSHGGGFLQYLDGKTAVTHVIASHLTPKKKVEFARYRIVKPAWIVDSISAGRVLPWNEYRVVDEGVTQKVLGFDNGTVVSQTNTQQRGYREQTDGSWYTSQLRRDDISSLVTKSTHTSPLPKAAAATPKVSSNPVAADLVTSAQPLPSALLTEDDGTTAVLTGRDDNSDLDVEGADSESTGRPQDPSKSQPSEAVLSATEESETTKTDTSPQKRQLTAEEHNAILLSNPHMAKSSTANPDFINQYYRESRLHHLSTWKADLKAQLQARAMEKSSSQKTKQKPPLGTRRYVLHVDFDSFFAAVSLRKNPHLVDKPVVIAHGSGPGSEIASCNYPARKFGVKNGMWMKTALGLCSDLKVLPYDFKAYEEASRHFYDSILAVDGVVQSISIDEALIDVSEQCIRAGGSDGRVVSEGSIYREQEKAQQIGNDIRAAVKVKTGCDVSVGIGNNILLAKVALRKAKPAGQYLIKPEEVLDFLGELLVTDLPGVAWSIGNKLEEVGVKLVKDIRALNKERLVTTLGPKTGEKLWDYSRGFDKQEVGEQVIRKSVSAEINWGIRFINQQQAEDFVQCLCDELSKRLLENLVKGKQLTMKIMRKAADAGMDPPKNLGHGKCDTFNKSIVLGVATTDKTILGREAISILRSYGFSPGELRGLGVQMQKLEPLKPLKESSEGASLQPDSSQRRLQFKKPAVPVASSSEHSVQAATMKPPPSKTPRKRLTNSVDPIEEVPTPERGRVVRTLEGAFDNRSKANDVGDNHKPLNLTGTQFVMPSQVDPAVLAELPADIRSKFAPKQKTIFDSISRSASPHIENRSRSGSPHTALTGQDTVTQSQIDPSVLAELPEDVRQEVLKQYSIGSTGLRSLPLSPVKAKAGSTSKRLQTTPTKKQKYLAASRRGRPKGASATSTLTQANFVSWQKADADAQSDEENVSESFLAELPEEIRLEILAEKKRNRMKAKSGLDLGTMKRKPRIKDALTAVQGQQTVPLPPQPSKPVFTSRGLSTLEELRDAMSAWVEEYSGADEAGPYDEDVSALGTYLSLVIGDEHDMDKAVSVIDWLTQVVTMQSFGDNRVGQAWTAAIASLRDHVQGAIHRRGLPPVSFD